MVTLLGSAAKLLAQDLVPGFDKSEYAELMAVSARTTNDTTYAMNLPKPQRFRLAYRSAVVGLDNMWDLWADGGQAIVISVRGTTRKQESWLENFYAAMIPAKGSIGLPGGTTFTYQLAPQPDAAVHVGWMVALASMSSDMRLKIDSAYASGTRNLLVHGHSQGGAIAYLVTAWLRMQQQSGSLPADLRIKTYCSAAPKPGNTQFAYAFDALTQNGWAFNVVNSADWVPETPVSIQTMQDFNRVNPFVGAKAGIRKRKFPEDVALLHVFNRLSKTPIKTHRVYRKYLGNMVGKRVTKLLPGLEVPAFVPGSNYARAGTAVVLLADSAYFRLYPDTSGNVFVHHLHKPYLHLLQQLATPNNATAMQHELEGNWELSYLAGVQEPIAARYPDRRPSLRIDATHGKVAGTTGCNRFNGGVNLGRGAISFSQAMALTRMFCPGEGEQLFLGALHKVNAYRLSENGVLTLMQDEQPVMRLERR